MTKAASRTARSLTPGQIKVESNVPFPEGGHIGRIPTYPWADMKPGDSFFVPNVTSHKFAGTIQSARKKRKSWTLVVRKEGTGIRVWRLADRALPPDFDDGGPFQ